MSSSLPVAELPDTELLQCAVCNSTLQDAVLLKCLHSTCRSCVCDATVNVACPVCRVVTDTSTTKPNLIVSALVQRSKVIKNMFICTYCTADGEQDAESVAWCCTCQKSLCTNCNKYHNRFNANHDVRQIDEHTVLSELYRPASRRCTEHDEKLKLTCFTCQDGRCLTCAQGCYAVSHNVQLSSSPAALDLLKVRVADAARVLTDLSSTEQLLQAHFSLPQKVAKAMEESREGLRNAKKTAIDSISKAYDKADQSLVECWEILASKAELLRESAESLKVRLDWANKYCQVALRTEDVTALLPQLDTLSSYLCSLLEEARLITQTVDPLKLVSMNVCLPDDLDLITSDWIGKATLLSEDLNCPMNDNANAMKSDYYARRVSVLSELEELLKKQKEQQDNLERDRLQLQQLQLQLKLKEQELATTENEKKKLVDQQQEQQKQLELERRKVEQLQSELKSKTEQLAAPTKPLSFDSKPRCTFKGRGWCRDVAVTLQGSLLVAAMAEGLKEYDATSFREKAFWKPDASLLGNNTYFYVATVDVLSDGRALVGVDPKLIVLLRSDVVSGGLNSSSAAAGVWQVERCIAAELQGPPRDLSAWDDRLLAVLEDRFERKEGWCCGPGLLLLSLSNGDKQLHRHKLDYDAGSVALTDRGVIVASANEVELPGDAVYLSLRSTRKKCYIVDCYSHMGVRLWRYEVGGGDKVKSLCSDSVGRVIYAAKCQGTVVALSLDDGRELSTVMQLSTTEIGALYAIAFGKAIQHRMVLLTKVGDDAPNSINVFAVS